MILEKYPSYKDFGVNWIDKIPSIWIQYRLKDVSLIQTSNVDKKANEDEKEVLLCNYIDVYKNEFITKYLNFMRATATKDQINKFKIYKNDVIITKDSETAEEMAKPAFVKEDLKGVICGYHLAIIRGKKKSVYNKYIFRLFQSAEFHWNFIIKSKGVTRFGLSINSSVNNQDVFLPNISEQIKISNFLDKKISQIDKKIKLLQEKKENYEEIKKTLINETVCRGLDKGVKLKDSEIKWIGKIPKHWKLVRLKDVSKKIFAGGTPSTRIEPYWNIKEIIWLPSGELQNNIIGKHSENKYISFEGFMNSSTKMIEPNTTLIALTGATCANVGYLTFQACANQSVVAITNSKEFISKYLFYYLLSKRNYIETFKTGGAQAGINTNDVKYIIFPNSSKEEQIQIANYLDEKTSKIEKIISKINDQIKALQEFRKTLINDVVTGKVRIQDE